MIGGNTTALFQIKSVTATNEIGQKIIEWKDIQSITGFLDLSGGDSEYTTFNAKLQESTHIFISDYVRLDASIKAENSRMLIDGGRYDVLMIDDPMGLHKQLEIYLKYTGGQ